MDNYNNNQSNDSFYSYNSGQTQNSGEQNTGTSQGAGAYQSVGTGQNSGMYQNTGTYQSGGGYQNTGVYGAAGSGTNGNTGYQGYGAAGNGTYQQNGMDQNTAWQSGAQPAGKKPRKKRDGKPGGFGIKLAKCAALALTFGLVSGTAFEGVRLASGSIFGEESAQSTSENVLTQETSDKLKSTSTSSDYVAADVSDIVEEAMPSIVAITNISESEYQSFWGGRPQTFESTSCGSGIIVGQDDDYLYIATNNHVVNGATSLTVTFNDNSTVSAEVKGTDPSTDLAVVKVNLDSIEEETMNNIKVATLGESDNLRVGEACIAIGNALGYGQSVTTGCISALDRQVSVSDSANNTNYTAELIQTDAAINPGNSGGALLNAAGQVIGINSVKYSDTSVEGIGYSIPISTAAPIINDLITKEKVDESESAYLGVAGVDVTSSVSSTYSMPSGVYVVQVIEGSAAEQAGIQKGDIITEIDGKEITSMNVLSTTLEYYRAGTEVEIKLQRALNGEYVEQVMKATLGKKN